MFGKSDWVDFFLFPALVVRHLIVKFNNFSFDFSSFVLLKFPILYYICILYNYHVISND